MPMKSFRFQPPLRSPRLRRGAALVLALACLGTVTGAHPAADPAPAAARSDAAIAPSAAQIVARNAMARGGLEAWQAVRTIVEMGHIEHGQIKGPKKRHGTPSAARGSLDQSLPFTLQIKRPHKMRLEMNLGDATALQLFDGTEGWTVQPSAKGPLVHKFSDAEAQAAATQVDPEGPLIDAAAKGTTVALDGEEVVEGRKAYKLALTLKSGAVRHVWIDAQTFLDLKLDGNRLIEGRLWPTESYFYDWKSAGGVKVPGRVETAIEDVRTSSRILVDRVIVNAPLADTMFSLPQSARGPGASGTAQPATAAPESAGGQKP